LLRGFPRFRRNNRSLGAGSARRDRLVRALYRAETTLLARIFAISRQQA